MRAPESLSADRDRAIRTIVCRVMSVALYFNTALILAFSVLVQAKYDTKCSKEDYNLFFDSVYSNLYLKLEEALISSGQLSKLRVSFTSMDSPATKLILYTQTNLEVGTLKDVNCGNDFGNFSFCYSEYTQKWTLCSSNLGGLTFSMEENYQLKIVAFIKWLAMIHGTAVPAILTENVFEKRPSYLPTKELTAKDITLSIDELDCNPSHLLLKCVLSELWSWIKVYSEAGGRPESRDHDLKGTVLRHYKLDHAQSNATKFVSWKMDKPQLVKLSLAEYVIVSLSAALLIAVIFPLLHSQIVSKAASSLGYQSLYWGSAVVANVLTYGLLLAAAKAWSIYIVYTIPYTFPIIICDYIYKNELCIASVHVLSVQEFVVYSILFVGALIASLRPNYGRVPLPTGTARVVFNVSLCFCFVCCPPRCRTKIPQILVLFGFMNFIYHCIMEALSIGFILFVEELRTIVITFMLLYMSLILFFVVFTSLIFFLVLRGPFYRTCIKCFAGALMLITVFSAVMLIVVMYMIIFFSLKLNGFSGILTGLIPSIALSGASWYIKQKIMKQDTRDPSNNASVQLEYGAVTKRADNDSDSERTMLLP